MSAFQQRFWPGAVQSNPASWTVLGGVPAQTAISDGVAGTGLQSKWNNGLGSSAGFYLGPSEPMPDLSLYRVASIALSVEWQIEGTASAHATWTVSVAQLNRGVFQQLTALTGNTPNAPGRNTGSYTAIRQPSDNWYPDTFWLSLYGVEPSDKVPARIFEVVCLVNFESIPARMSSVPVLT